ncbi:MAG: DUF3592 domain-containing protein [Reyranella sp.]|uniref:DUF3592 domain-containing protein n=1 Tax=Reyranella sp. TaxID=1929291 RepID=UPI00120EF711|nr:DUF3592 domain-containing protein [Reyranella sp.]TAJ98154.1 MAG: DUF3592 domain-containing protein [Reyranella sp.]TBR26837.1 MAG: DUF3592 domain-containing protein [Reyranella sp.]
MAIDASWRWIAWTILGIGGLITAGGVLMGLGNLRHALYGERADGIVTEIVREGDMYAPVVRFRLPQGETVEVKELGSGAPDFAAGDTVTVIYLPENPQDFRLDTFERLWLVPIIVTGFGGFWLMFGAVSWALSRNADLALVGERVFSVISLSALLISVFVLWSAVDLYASGGRALGTVAEIRESRSIVTEEVTTPAGREVCRDVERISFAPIVRFTTPEGREIEFHGRGGSGTSFAAGEAVNVVYDRGQPGRARIVSFVDLWLPAAVAFAVALVFGAAVRLSRWSRRRATG